jgi:hypothetical protein
VAVVWVSVIKRKKKLKRSFKIFWYWTIKLQYTLHEEIYMNIKMSFNIISESVLLTVFYCALISHNIYDAGVEPYYIIVLQTIGNVIDICNTLFLFQFLNLIFKVKQRYSHLNKRLNKWINKTVRRSISLKKENERYIRSHRTADHAILTPLYVSSIGNFEGTLK